MRLLTQSLTMNILRLDNHIEILFSYGVPVAGYTPDKGFFRVDEQYSNTTTRHVNSYIGGQSCDVITKKAMDCLLMP